MPKVVSGLGMVDFVQTGKHQTIDAGEKRGQAPTIEKTPEAKEAIAKAEAETAKAMQPEAEKEESGLEAGDEDLAERAQTRINKKHREMRQAEALAKKLRGELEDSETFSKATYQRAQLAEERANDLQRQLTQLQAATPAKVEPGTALIAPDENDPKFRNEKGEFVLKVYEKARDEYLKAQFREEMRQEQQAEQKRRADEAWALKVKAFEGQLEKIREKYPDFSEKASKLDIVVPPYIQSFMVKSPFGGEIGNYFVNHPEVLERLKTIDADEAIAEIGEIAAQWKKPAATETKETGKTLADILPFQKPSASSPITPLSGAGSPGVNADPAKMSPKELLVYTRERELARKKNR